MEPTYFTHDQLAALGPVRVSVRSSLFEAKINRRTRMVASLTVHPKGKEPYFVLYVCENEPCYLFFYEASQPGKFDVPFTVVAEGTGESANLVKVGEAVPPGAPAGRSQHPKPHDTRATAATTVTQPAGQPVRPDPESAAARVFSGRRVGLMRLAAWSVKSFKDEAAAAGMPPMSDEAYWKLAERIYLSLEAEGLAIRAGFADKLPVNVTFDKLAQWSRVAVDAVQPTPQQPARREPAKPAAAKPAAAPANDDEPL